VTDGSSPPAVVTLGETMVLLHPPEGDSLATASALQRTIGGAESNLAIALVRLGHTVRWISRLGADPFGAIVRETLRAEGVDVVAASDDGAPTAVFFKERATGVGRHVFYYRAGSAASRMSAADVAPSSIAGARVLHVTGITPALSASCAEAVSRAIDLARETGVSVTVDPNVRPQLWPSADEARRVLSALMARGDTVLLGHEDAAYLFPRLSPREVLEAVEALGPRTVILKRGDLGAMMLHDGTVTSCEALPVTVVDTVGAGDGFDAGFIAGMLRGEPVERCLRFGIEVGAAAVTMAGDWEGYPRAEVLERIGWE
jgi:2-dehydro-3-deoxygluconokinase